MPHKTDAACDLSTPRKLASLGAYPARKPKHSYHLL